jgi:hypothetical protein
MVDKPLLHHGLGRDPAEMPMPAPEGVNETVAATLAAAWFERHGLKGGATNKQQFVDEFREMLLLVREADRKGYGP